MNKIIFWSIVVLTLYGAAVTVAFGFIALINPGLISPDKIMNPAALFYANHFAVRNFVIALMMVLPLVLKEKKIWAFALFIRGLAEFSDSILEIVETKSAFPGSIFFIFAVLFTISSLYILNLSKKEKR